MAANIPASLKAADIGRFAIRAAQVERAKPVIAYWCNYWIVNQIISKGLHNSDEEAIQYTTKLMDKLEQFKSENSDNDAVTDNVAAQAYVEQFGLEVFSRADNAVRANKATKQTADTFQAAATFLELCQIWGQLDPDIASKIKFAKYHAVRIAKAIKNGEDPNLSNPAARKETKGLESQTLDPNDPEVQELQGKDTTKARQPSVEEVPDESDGVERRLAQQSILDESLHPSRSSSVPPYPSAAPPPPSAPPSQVQPDPVSHPSAPDLPSTPSDFTLPQVPPKLPDAPGAEGPGRPSSSIPRASFESFPPPSPAQPPEVPNLPQPPTTYYTQPSAAAPPPAPPTLPPQSTTGKPAPVRPAAPAAAASTSATTTQEVDDQAISLAQKHARWAVSALSFDDVNTAIKELRNALRYLGAE
ncbi:hypothetical protein VTN77DRAFT_4161 [Rasamsonia byssochlamydoides]|uniref:uncharacterized protein n=1 Tax=Rasamsonia byssochlamydoides TaxID=89139 RepID=UPI00374345DD